MQAACPTAHVHACHRVEVIYRCHMYEARASEKWMSRWIIFLALSQAFDSYEETCATKSAPFLQDAQMPVRS